MAFLSIETYTMDDVKIFHHKRMNQNDEKCFDRHGNNSKLMNECIFEGQTKLLNEVWISIYHLIFFIIHSESKNKYSTHTHTKIAQSIYDTCRNVYPTVFIETGWHTQPDQSTCFHANVNRISLTGNIRREEEKKCSKCSRK